MAHGAPIELSISDQLLAINSHKINDLIDYRYYSADEHLRMTVKKADARIIEIEYDAGKYGPLELEFEPEPIKRCKNKCIFCFIHQLPKGLRKMLYVKDEDYRQSFLHGNYITLTNLSEEDYKRIIKMRLSPLYISVHTTDENLRRYMLGKPDLPPLLPQIERLIKAGIDLHTQIVLCPGVNDNTHLEKTIKDLAKYHPHLKSVAVVPVGLTRHRQHLPKLKAVTPIKAREVLRQCADLQDLYMKK